MLENAHQGYALKMILEVYLLDFYIAFLIENRWREFRAGLLKHVILIMRIIYVQ